MVTKVNAVVGQLAYSVPKSVITRRSTGMTLIIAEGDAECLGNSNCRQWIVNGQEISSSVTNGIQMVMVASAVVGLLESFAPKLTAGPLTTEMIPTTEGADVA